MNEISKQEILRQEFLGGSVFRMQEHIDKVRMASSALCD